MGSSWLWTQHRKCWAYGLATYGPRLPIQREAENNQRGQQAVVNPIATSTDN
jgi:hypothetical protein